MKNIFFVLILILPVAVNLLPAQEKKIEDAEFFFNQCKANLEKENPDKAIEYGEKAIALDNNVAKYHFYYGKACLNKAQKSSYPLLQFQLAQKTKKAWETAVQLDSKNVEIRYHLGQFYYAAAAVVPGGMEKAKEQAAEISKLHPIKGQLLFAEIYTREKNPAKAEKSMETAYRLHLDFKKKHPSEQSDFYPVLLNRYGYQSLQKKEVEKAIMYFKWNVKAFPENFNGYDSLAEAYVVKGDKELALKYYKKALALNPNKTTFEKKAYNLEVKNIKTLQEQLNRKE